MGKTIVSGSFVWVRGADRPHWGEVWVFCEPDAGADAGGVVAVHRSVGRRDGRNRFWGDGNVEADVLVDDALLVGRVIAVQSPAGRYRRTRRVEELVRASYVGARRLPRRVWYRGRALLRDRRAR
jgi:hypothetical protein